MLKKVRKPASILSLFLVSSLSLSLPALAAKEGTQHQAHGAKTTESTTQLLKRLERYQSLEGRFKQTLAAKDGKIVQATEGAFSLKRPGLYRWLSDEPYPQEVVGNGKTIWIFDPDLEQVTITPQENMPFNPATLLSGGLEKLRDQYKVNQQVSDDKTERFEFVPVKQAEPLFDRLALEFKGAVIHSVSFMDQLGQKTMITFSDVKTNTTIEDSQFEFIVPEGADILVNE